MRGSCLSDQASLDQVVALFGGQAGVKQVLVSQRGSCGDSAQEIPRQEGHRRAGWGGLDRLRDQVPVPPLRLARRAAGQHHKRSAGYSVEPGITSERQGIGDGGNRHRGAVRQPVVLGYLVRVGPGDEYIDGPRAGDHLRCAGKTF